jgi:ribosomal protein S18 acetylase RimI-like enzyme
MRLSLEVAGCEEKRCNYFSKSGKERQNASSREDLSIVSTIFSASFYSTKTKMNTAHIDDAERALRSRVARRRNDDAALRIEASVDKQSAVWCSSRAFFLLTSLLFMSIPPSSSFEIFTPIGRSRAVHMAMATVEEVTVTDEKLQLFRNLTTSRGFPGTKMVNDSTHDPALEGNAHPGSRGEANETQQASSSDSNSDDVRSEDEMERRRKELVKANLLGRGTSPSRSKNQYKDTSVGARRIGSATKARQSATAPSRVMDSLWKTAATKSKDEREKSQSDDKSSDGTTLSSLANSVQSLTRSDIMHAVEEALSDRKSKLGNMNPVVKSNLTAADFTHTYERPMGLVVEDKENDRRSVPFDFPGAIVAHPTPTDNLLVRIATPSDDFQIAALRLSVFSDFTPEQQVKFCERSCQAISSRRLRGACCLIAAHENDTETVLGSAECSYHEFFGTRLGQRRPQFSILYVTEVAVDIDARGQGIGKKLMDAVDIYAKSRNIETIYLHVDVENKAALSLYAKSGYERVNGEEDSMYLEFTTSLHLHPGATKGRDHYLMYKNLIPDPVWLQPREARMEQGVETKGKLGFEVSV